MELWLSANYEQKGVVTFYAIMMQGLSEKNLLDMSVTTSVPRARDEWNHFPAR